MIRRAPAPTVGSPADRVRFEGLYAETRTAILGYLLRRVADPEDAADLLADVFATAWRRIDDVPAGDEARLWLYGVARNVVANHRRRTRTRTGLAVALEHELRVRAAGEEDHADEDAAAVRAALARLNDRDRELLTLNVWEDLAPAQIAIVLGRPAGVVRVQLHRARGRLGDQLRGDPASGTRMRAGTTASR